MINQLLITHIILGHLFLLILLLFRTRFTKAINRATFIVDLHHQKNNKLNTELEKVPRKNQLNILNKEKFTFKELVIAYISFIFITWMICFGFILSAKIILLRSKEIRDYIYKEDFNEKG